MSASADRQPPQRDARHAPAPRAAWARELFSFPNPVNEKAARTVAAGAAALAVVTLVTGWGWLTVPLSLGFLARVATGPTLSPLGQLATRVIAPRLGAARPTAGPPKRFAQGIGAVVTTAAALWWLIGGWGAGPFALVALIAVAATLESALGFCIGCRAFAVLMRLGIVPESVCLDCADVSRRIARALQERPAAS